MRYENVNWIQLAQDMNQLRKLLNMVINLLVPYKTENFLTIYVTVSFSRRTTLHALSFTLLRNDCRVRHVRPYKNALYRDISKLN
jgi:hypothetical protein